MIEPLVSAFAVNVVRDGRSILEDVDLEVRSGEIVTIIGPNGGGKTTLLRTVLGLIAPTSGTVTRRRDLRMGYVPQRFAADRSLPLTARRFLALAPGARRRDCEQALGEVGAAALAEAQLATLSGGEVQRVLLARALLRNPQLLLLDEPTQGVDLGGEQDLYELITTVRDRHACGVLMVSHHVHVVMGTTDRVVCLNRHVTCTGRPTEIRRDREYLRLFGENAAALLGVYAHDHHDHSHAERPTQRRAP
jgi:zinc transport system ATP-binding protein